MIQQRFPKAALIVLVIATTQSVVTIPASARSLQGPSSSSSEVGGGGKQYTVRITYTGDVKGAGGGPGGGSRTVSVPVPVKCWWEPASSSYKDPQAMYDWYMGMANAHSTSQFASEHLGSYQDYQDVIDQAKAGKKYYWYEANCLDDTDLAEFTHDSIGAVTYMKAFPVVDGEPTVPAPRVEPDQVALQAYQELDLLDPVLDRNPKATRNGHTGFTLVTVPTWFWVTNTQALGGPDGTRTITATVEKPDGTTLSVHLTARTPGLQLTSPAATTTTCPPTRATVAWKTGLHDEDGCTLNFTRASTGQPQGHPVTATITWTATWTTTTNTTPRPLPDGTRTITTTTHVPVAEIQAIVTDIR